LWSLAVEEQFYLVTPLVVRLTRPRNLKWVLFAVIAIAIGARLWYRFVFHDPPIFITTRTIGRVDSLAIGMLAAILVRSEAASRWLSDNLRALRALLVFLGVGVLLLFLFSYGSSTAGMQTVGFTWMACFYTALLLLAVQNRTGSWASFLRNPFLRELGSVSYCVYLIHVVVNVTLHAVILRSPPRISNLAGVLVTILAVAVSYGVAKLSWICFEGPLQRRGHAYKY
jgi:peptidoglycan/LPS O-acetylase OafA/YrhL